jgi:hypothetical protein
LPLNWSPVFFDCEASSLDGFIIEVGWAYFVPETRAIASEGHLIRPPLDWNISEFWDDDAEALHGITPDKLHTQGEPVWRVASIMNESLKGRELFSDSPKDEIWLGQLFDAAGITPSFTVRRMDTNVLLEQTVLNRNFDLKKYREAKTDADQRRPHRAEADSILWAQLWLTISVS